MRCSLRCLVLIATAVAAAGCTRGPEPQRLVQDVQQRLDTLLDGPVLVVRALNRQGSAPYGTATDGAVQVIVYYNATLEFARSYDPSDWASLSPQSIAGALGATDEGVVGFSSGPMAPGAVLRAYGSIVYRRDGDVWQPTGLREPHRAVAGEARTAGGAGLRTDDLIRRLAEVVDTSPGLDPARDAIVAEEIDRALQKIRLRLDTGGQAFSIATGPEGGEYSRFVASLGTRFAKHAAPRTIRAAHTAGSVTNAFMVDRGEARFGLVQSDVAAAAVTGAGPFGTAGALRRLRAVTALFPEPVHIIVRTDSSLGSVADLAGRRVVLGSVGSGTRYTALQVLSAHDLDPAAYTEVAVDQAGDALDQLSAGTLDAVIEVVSAPWAQLTQRAAAGGLRLLSLDAQAIEKIATSAHGVVPLDVPARTYPGQQEPVRSVAATALLVTNSDMPDAIVTTVIETLFTATAAAGAGVSAARLAPGNARIGVTIPLHDGAAHYFENRPGS